MFRFYTDYEYTILGMSVEHVSFFLRKTHEYGYIGVTVQILGSPVKYGPNDATYKIRIWQNKIYANPVINDPNQFEDQHFVSEFSISPTEDPIDLELRYGNILRKYDVTKIKPVHQPFDAQCKRQSYIDQFIYIINNIVNSKDKERAPMENDHLVQRKKRTYAYC